MKYIVVAYSPSEDGFIDEDLFDTIEAAAEQRDKLNQTMRGAQDWRIYGVAFTEIETPANKETKNATNKTVMGWLVMADIDSGEWRMSEYGKRSVGGVCRNNDLLKELSINFPSYEFSYVVEDGKNVLIAVQELM